MKALKIALLVSAWLSLGNLRADTWNMGVSATANTGGSGARNPAQLLGYDPSTNSIRMLQCDANGNLLTSSGAPTTFTTGVTYVSNTISASTITDFALNAVTYASSVDGTSYRRLTDSAVAYLYIGNDNTVPLYCVLSTSATAPTNTSTVRISIPPGGLAMSMRNGGLAMGYSFLHWFWPASSAATVTPTAHYGY